MIKPRILALILIALLSASLCSAAEVVIDSLTITPSEQLIATFTENGTGEVEDFSLESSSDLKAGSWQVMTATIFTPDGAGKWTATTPVDLDNSRMFFRVTKNGIVLTATFSVPTLVVREGDSAAGTIVTFNQPFTGTLRYKIGGTPGSQTLTNATSVRIDVPTDGTLDDAIPGNLRTIILNLELEGGGATSYTLGVNSSSTLVIEDDDALWSGTMKLPNKGGEIGIRILRTQQAGVVTTCFKTDKGGLIPTAPAGTNWLFNNFELDLATNTFAAAVTGVTIPAGSTIYNSDTQLSVVFAAAGADKVTATKIEGEFSLSSTVATSPHLDIPELTGTFTLLRNPDQAGGSSAPTAP